MTGAITRMCEPDRSLRGNVVTVRLSFIRLRSATLPGSYDSSRE